MTWLVTDAAAEEPESAAARKIIDRAIEAAGGREALKRYEKPFYMKRQGKALGGTGWEDFTIKVTTWLPDKLRTDQESTRNGKKMPFGIRFNGEKGFRVPGTREMDANSLVPETREMDASSLRNTRDLLYSQWLATLLPLDDPQFKLTALDEIMLDGRPAVGVNISCEDRPAVRLHFDKDAMTLVKLSREFNGRLFEETYDDFAELDGLIYPKRIVQYANGKKFAEMSTAEFKFLDEVDEAIFEQP
ncbi:MAG TPA: hypothetical protein VGN42_18300 [Pirellulales bacterium]|jgi:hypothetical protein|nr:hypothetical protein [Pirellulales bacterium]